MNVVAVAYGRFQPLCLTEKKIGALESWSYMGDGSFQWKFDCLLVKEHIKGCGRIAFQVHQAFFPLKHDFVSF